MAAAVSDPRPLLHHPDGATGAPRLGRGGTNRRGGSSLLFPYMAVAGFCIVLLLPVTPFVHRMSCHVPTFLFLAFIGTLIYNLSAFPFSEMNRYKTYFQQTLDITTGDSKVRFAGLEEYVRMIINELPAARGKEVECTPASPMTGLVLCEFDGVDVPPRLAATTDPGDHGDLIHFNATRQPKKNEATLEIDGINTKACFVRFENTVSHFEVEGSTRDERFGSWPENGLQELKLWRRDWEKTWKVHVEWTEPKDDEWVVSSKPSGGKDNKNMGEGDEESEDDLRIRRDDRAKNEEQNMKLRGKIVCIWSDANAKGRYQRWTRHCSLRLDGRPSQRWLRGWLRGAWLLRYESCLGSEEARRKMEDGGGGGGEC